MDSLGRFISVGTELGSTAKPMASDGVSADHKLVEPDLKAHKVRHCFPVFCHAYQDP